MLVSHRSIQQYPYCDFLFLRHPLNSSILKTLKVPQKRKSLLPKLFERMVWGGLKGGLPPTNPPNSINRVNFLKSREDKRSIHTHSVARVIISHRSIDCYTFITNDVMNRLSP